MRRKPVRQMRECLLPRAAVMPRDLRRGPRHVAAVGAVAGERPAAGTVDRAGIKPCLAPRHRGNVIAAGEWSRIPDLRSSAVSSSIFGPSDDTEPRPAHKAGQDLLELLPKARAARKERIRPPGQAAECLILFRIDPAKPEIANGTIAKFCTFAATLAKLIIRPRPSGAFGAPGKRTCRDRIDAPQFRCTVFADLCLAGVSGANSPISLLVSVTRCPWFPVDVSPTENRLMPSTGDRLKKLVAKVTKHLCLGFNPGCDARPTSAGVSSEDAPAFFSEVKDALNRPLVNEECLQLKTLRLQFNCFEAYASSSHTVGRGNVLRCSLTTRGQSRPPPPPVRYGARYSRRMLQFMSQWPGMSARSS